MAESNHISEYINNLNLRRKLVGGYDPDDVYEAIRQITVMYASTLSRKNKEQEILREQLRSMRQKLEQIDVGEQRREVTYDR